MPAAAFANDVTQDGPTTLESRDGRKLWLDFAMETVTSLRHGTPAAGRLARAVCDARSGAPLSSADFGRLADEDLLRIDLDTITFGKSVLDAADAPAILILPISFHTLSARKSRRDVTDALGASLKSRVMLELMDVDRGTPLSRLSEVGGVAAALGRGVLVRLAPGRDAAAAVKGYRPHGVTVEAVGLGEGDSELAAGMLAFAEQTRGAAPTVMVFGLPSEDFFAIAGVGGVTHASARRAA
jgi:hypothetical protein